ncbi:MAG: Asp-tRNA(Asn)/Glu-tRNA(Gln) amidotransferase GatCAB subunit A [Promethearchaeota archaeon Loki_b32]|nr:MAG: Asp-tRNA(Asn)/Glu-tRNA(Gln) amidotransferase GatCAB subunit A [Candidatus Lokiarchaeota archaeon Loki_b32]
MRLHKFMAHELFEKIRSKEISILELIESCFERIEETDHLLHSFVNLSKEKAIKKAKLLDNNLKKGKKIGKLYGLPIANKDLICVKDFPTTCSSKILKDYRPPYNAFVIEHLIEQEGAIHIGNTNMDEFAMGSSTENSCYGPTNNPWDLTHVPGGSSGGSAASIASGQAILALGSDTGGSIRCPASFCGVVGLKPTYGRVSRYGLVAFANSLDQIGPITKCVYDSALMLEIMSGKDPLDSTSVDIRVDKYTQELKKPIDKKILGIPEEFFGDGIDSEVHRAVKDAINKLENLGAKIMEVSIPHLEYTVATYYLLCMSEASSNLARYDGLRYGIMSDNLSGDVYDVFSRTRSENFGPEVRRRIFLGTYALSAGYYDMFYIKALKVRSLIKNDFDEAFKRCDSIVCPTMPTTAFKLGQFIDDPLQMYIADILTCPVNLAGIPALSIPCGFDNNGLPIGFQIIGNFFDEKGILNIGYQLEQELNIYRKIAPVTKGG